MSDKKPEKPKSRPYVGVANDHGLPPIQNTLPMPKVQPPKKEK